jgi:hypothetical protein
MIGFTQMGADFFVSHRLHGLHGLGSVVHVMGYGLWVMGAGVLGAGVLSSGVVFNSGAFNRTQSIQQRSVQPSQLSRPSQLSQPIIRVHLCSFICAHLWEVKNLRNPRAVSFSILNSQLSINT